MIKLLATFTFAGFVLLTGLISCSPDKDSKAIDYNPPLPLIMQEQVTTDLKAWDTNPTKQISPADQLDVRLSLAARMIVETVCQSGASSFMAKVSPPPNDLLRFFKILPEEILLMDLGSKEVHCTFSLSLWNEAGARHVFTLQGRIVGDAPAEVEIEKGGMAINHEPLLKIDQRELVGLQVRYSNTPSSQAYWACQDITFTELPFNNVAELAHFAVFEGKIRKHHSKLSIELRPSQICRIFIVRSQDGLPIATSPRFKFAMSRSALQIHVQSSLREPTAGALQGLYDKLFKLSSAPYAPLLTLRIKNQGLAARQIRLPNLKQKLDIDVAIDGHQIVGFQGGEGPIRKYYHCAFSQPAAQWTYEDPLLTDDKLGRVVLIEPLSEIDIQLSYAADKPLMSSPGYISTLELKISKLPKIEELDADQQVVGSIELEPELFQLGKQLASPSVARSPMTSERPCLITH